jgi:hypothetical protein
MYCINTKRLASHTHSLERSAPSSAAITAARGFAGSCLESVKFLGGRGSGPGTTAVSRGWPGSPHWVLGYVSESPGLARQR